MDKRRFTRVPFKAMAQLKSADGTITVKGNISDMSLNGLLLEADNLVPMGTVVHIIIYLEGGGPDVQVELEGKVVRVGKSCEAIQFNLSKIPLKSFTFLRNIITYNLGDEESVLREYHDYLHDGRQQPKKDDDGAIEINM